MPNLQVNFFGKCREFRGGELLLYTGVALNQTKRNPLRIVQVRMFRFDGSGEACHLLSRVFGKREITIRLANKLAVHHFFDSEEQFCQPLSRARRSSHYGNTQSARKCFEIQLNFIAFRFVNQVHAEHSTVSDLKHLENHIHVALQSCGICYHHRDIRLPEEDEIARYLLILRSRGERIRTWQVDNAIGFSFIFKETFRLTHCFSGPVTSMLL